MSGPGSTSSPSTTQINHILTTSEYRSIDSSYEKGQLLYETGEYSIRQIAVALGVTKSKLHNYINGKHMNENGRPKLMDLDQINYIKDFIINECLANNSQTANQIALQA
jgi:hypothetical protein